MREKKEIQETYLIDGKYSFKELLDINDLEKILTLFSEATGYTASIATYPEGEFLISTEWRNLCVEFHRADPKMERQCIESDTELRKNIKKTKKLQIGYCKNGLIDAGAPIIIKGVHVANLYTGQVFFEKPNLSFFKDQATEVGYETETYKKALREIPIVDENTFKKSLTFLSEIAVTLAEEGLANLRNDEAIQTAKESETRYRNLFDSVPVGIYRSTPEGHFLDGNPALVKILGYPSEEVMLNANVNDLYPDQNIRREELASIEDKGALDNHVMQLRRYDGKIIWVQDSAKVIRDSAGEVLYYYGRLEDITERVLIEKELRKSEIRYRSLVEQSNDVIYLLYENHFEMVNQKFVDVFGISAEEACSVDFNFMSLVAPQSQKMLQQRTEKLRKGEELPLRYEFTAYDKNKEEIEMSVSVSYISYKEGRATQGILRDITESKKSNKALRKSEKKFRDLFEKSEDAILIIENGQFVDCNNATIKMLRYKNKEEFLTSHPSELSPEKQPDGKNSLEKADEMMQIALKNGSHRFIWDHLRANGEVFPVEVLLTAISTNRDNRVIHTTWRDITKRVQAEKKLRDANEQLHKQIAEIKELETALREQAIRDPLTGLFNRRYLEEVIEQDLLKASRKEIPLSIIIVDLDALKEINDTYGHITGGDQALQTLANTISATCRAEDTICRYGGDEFLVILYDTPLHIAKKRALEWRENIKKEKLFAKNMEFEITFSAGVAVFPENGLSSEELLIQADNALYKAKEMGRNRVITAHHENSVNQAKTT
ncbi:MAG: PAS domain S-box protein [Chloroflexi bacterium]|nr:PAS domain S-box protein [Chloroflexota bacterium]